MSSFLLCSLWIFLIGTVLSSNDTNTTTETTGAPSPATTEFFTTTTAAPYTYNPTLEPTAAPTFAPVAPPTAAPTIFLDDNEAILVEMSFVISGTDVSVDWVYNNEAFLIQLFIDSCNVNGENVQVSIGTVTENSSQGRRLLQSGVEIEFLVSFEESSEYNTFKEQVESDGFAQEFNEGLTDDAVLDSTSVTYEITGTGDSETFFGEEDETFAETLTSPFILLGVVCSIIGIVWLLFLRTSLTTKYPNYTTLSSGSSAIEMEKVTSSDPLGMQYIHILLMRLTVNNHIQTQKNTVSKE